MLEQYAEGKYGGDNHAGDDGGFYAHERRIHDAFFQGDKECTQTLLRAVTGIEDLIVVDSVTQYVYKNLGGGRSIRLDIRCTDSTGRLFDVEIENSTGGLRPRRNRLYAGVMDAAYKEPGEYGEKLPDLFIIFICANDPFGKGLGEYVVEKTILQTGDVVDDGLTEIYLYIDGDQRTQLLADLMHDFKCKDASAMRIPEFRRRMAHIKETKEGETMLSEATEKLIAERVAQSEARGENKATKLMMTLFRLGRIDDAERAEHDEVYREELYKELQLT